MSIMINQLITKFHKAGLSITWIGEKGFVCVMDLTISISLRVSLGYEYAKDDKLVWFTLTGRNLSSRPILSHTVESLLVSSGDDDGIDLMRYITPLIDQLDSMEIDRFKLVYADGYSFTAFAQALDCYVYYQTQVIENDITSLSFRISVMATDSDLEYVDHFIIATGYSRLHVPFADTLDMVLDNTVQAWDNSKRDKRLDKGYASFENLKAQVRRNRLTKLGI